MDYATQYGVSLSTLRRHIKAGKVQFKSEGGRYLLRSPDAPAIAAPRPTYTPPPAPAARPVDDSAALQGKLSRAQEEITELKMLIAIYEEQLAQLKRPTHLGF